MPPMTDLSPQEAMETPQKTGRSPNEAWLHVLSLAALTSQTVPGSPGTYAGRVEKRRKEYKTRKHDELRNDTIKPEEPQTKRVRLDDESVLGSSVDETPPPTIDGEDRMEAINAEDM
jgi:hypothetical protein